MTTQTQLTEETTSKFYARTIRYFIDAPGLQKISSLGNSPGGMTAMRFASDFPDRIDKLMVPGTRPVALASPESRRQG